MAAIGSESESYREQAIGRMREEGKTTAEIARVFNLSASRITGLEKEWRDRKRRVGTPAHPGPRF